MAEDPYIQALQCRRDRFVAELDELQHGRLFGPSIVDGAARARFTREQIAMLDALIQRGEGPANA